MEEHYVVVVFVWNYPVEEQNLNVLVMEDVGIMMVEMDVEEVEVVEEDMIGMSEIVEVVEVAEVAPDLVVVVLENDVDLVVLVIVILNARNLDQAPQELMIHVDVVVWVLRKRMVLRLEAKNEGNFVCLLCSFVMLFCISIPSNYSALYRIGVQLQIPFYHVIALI